MTVGQRWLSRLRLRHKLSLSLSIAALLPVLVVWWVAGRVVLDNLDRGIRDDAKRQLWVGLDMVVRTVQSVGEDAAQMAAATELATAMVVPDDPSLAEDTRAERIGAIRRFLDRMHPYLPSSLVQLFDANGRAVAETIVGHVGDRFDGLRIKPGSEAVRAGLSAKGQLTFETAGGVVVVRAEVPIVDASYRLRGVMVVSVPLDRAFAASMKGALGTDVLFFAGSGEALSRAASTFIGADGKPVADIALPPVVAQRVASGESVLVTDEFVNRSYTVALTALDDLDHKQVGVLAVAVDRAPLSSAQKVATRSLVLGAIAAVALALLLSAFLSRRLTRSISVLHRGARAVARGELEYDFSATSGDEIGDLSTAFANMTGALKENRERLAARMNEIIALHDAARAVSSVIDLDEVLRQIVESVARVLDVRLCALWLVESQIDSERRLSDSDDSPIASGDTLDVLDEWLASRLHLRLGAASVKPVDMGATMHGIESAEIVAPLERIARKVALSHELLRVDDVGDGSSTQKVALSAGVTGSLLATPLLRARNVVGVLVVGRTQEVIRFSDADTDLLSTFADQAASAVANARLYEEVRAFNEELERKVRDRTTELTMANTELEKTLSELRETQAQLVSSERMAGLGLLVASVAHEINSPSAAIAGSVDALSENAARLIENAHALATLGLDGELHRGFTDYVDQVAPQLAARPLGAAAAVRRAARALRGRLQAHGIAVAEAKRAAGLLAELGTGEDIIQRYLMIVGSGAKDDVDERSSVLVGYLLEHVFMHKNTLTIRNAIRRIQRIVGSLKRFSRLDQEAAMAHADVHNGIDDTLLILDYVLRDIKVTRQYGNVPHVPAYVDELNQVWTNLIHNAIQAMEGKGHITIETAVADGGVCVRIIDDGPGVPADVLPKIFEPFFTTKAKGEGTGLGLGIVRQIIDKHDGRVSCDSRPGHTCFRVWLPLERAGHSDVLVADSDAPAGDAAQEAVT